MSYKTGKAQSHFILMILSNFAPTLIIEIDNKTHILESVRVHERLADNMRR